MPRSFGLDLEFGRSFFCLPLQFKKSVGDGQHSLEGVDTLMLQTDVQISLS